MFNGMGRERGGGIRIIVNQRTQQIHKNFHFAKTTAAYFTAIRKFLSSGVHDSCDSIQWSSLFWVSLLLQGMDHTLRILLHKTLHWFWSLGHKPPCETHGPRLDQIPEDPLSARRVLLGHLSHDVAIPVSICSCTKHIQLNAVLGKNKNPKNPKTTPTKTHLTFACEVRLSIEKHTKNIFARA